MEQKQLNIELRDKTGKGISRQLRTKGFAPAVVYGKGIEPVAVSVNAKEFFAAVAGEGGQNTLITLQGGGALNGTVVIVADINREAIKGGLKHVDFHKIALDEKVKVEVSIRVVGSAKGVKDGGLLDQALHKLQIECLPTAIPEHIDVDVTELTLGHSIHVGELKLPAGVKALDDVRASVVAILGRAKEEAAAEA